MLLQTLDTLDDLIGIADTMSMIVVVALLLAAAIAVAVWPIEAKRAAGVDHIVHKRFG
jgi:hypothetical protein